MTINEAREQDGIPEIDDLLVRRDGKTGVAINSGDPIIGDDHGPIFNGWL